MKILRICLWFIFRNRRIFVFVFGPFSIFVATLIPNINTVLYYTMQADTRKGGVIWVQIRSDIRNRPSNYTMNMSSNSQLVIFDTLFVMVTEFECSYIELNNLYVTIKAHVIKAVGFITMRRRPSVCTEHHT